MHFKQYIEALLPTITAAVKWSVTKKVHLLDKIKYQALQRLLKLAITISTRQKYTAFYCNKTDSTQTSVRNRIVKAIFFNT